MTPLITIFSATATLSLVIVFHILAKLSRQFGRVLKMKDYYKGYYFAEVLGGIAFIMHLLQASLLLSGSKPTLSGYHSIALLGFHHLPLALAVTIAIIITWKYWSWLVIEKES